MEGNNGNKKKIILICSICTAVVAAIVAGVILLAPILFPKSSDTGAKQAKALYELGILQDYDGIYLAKTTKPAKASEAILRLLGSGDDTQAVQFYRYLQIEQAPDLTFPKEQETLTETEAYALLLEALGYATAPAQTLNKAKEVGFGFLREVRDSGQALTNGDFALILYEALLVRPPNAQNYPTYRILGYLNSQFKEALLAQGLYDAIPEEYVPLFNAGVYKPDSFARLPGSQNEVEWVATYLNVGGTYATDYVAALLKDGWTREGTYEVEGDPKATIEVLYRPLTTGSTQELGLVVKMYANNMVEWALFLN
ncbi:MAG: hypothetical protein IKU26_08790 [Clostridia bacterium]|nr:hypothetical protein [Clostridia bacterium]